MCMLIHNKHIKRHQNVTTFKKRGMATSRLSNNTTLSSSKNDRRQVEARIRALQQRTSAYLS
jgi:hypothetical protein